jgi:UDP-N-acetylmuramyl tripeptide synthase
MVVELFEGQGLRVFTNRTGSNFTRGVAAALLGEISVSGKLRADIAVLELDEAHAIHFVRAIKPRYSLLLNVMRDQLDRFGEIDATAKLLQTIAEHTTAGVILNREDARVRAIAQHVTPETAVHYFGLAPSLRTHFAHEDTPHHTPPEDRADVVLTDFSDQSATFAIDNVSHATPLKLSGIYNTFNAAAALATVKSVLGEKTDIAKLIDTLAQVTPAFGRGEVLTVHSQPLELVLVKNPGGFRLGLSSYSPDGYATMIAVNDNYADGRDMSWLWDVSFESLAETGVSMVSGIRAYDMALRLSYDAIPTKSVEPDLVRALHDFIAASPDSPKRIYCTYTAMLTLRKELTTITDVKAIDS